MFSNQFFIDHHIQINIFDLNAFFTGPQQDSCNGTTVIVKGLSLDPRGSWCKPGDKLYGCSASLPLTADQRPVSPLSWQFTYDSWSRCQIFQARAPDNWESWQIRCQDSFSKAGLHEKFTQTLVMLWCEFAKQYLPGMSSLLQPYNNPIVTYCGVAT